MVRQGGDGHLHTKERGLGGPAPWQLDRDSVCGALSRGPELTHTGSKVDLASGA